MELIIVFIASCRRGIIAPSSPRGIIQFYLYSRCMPRFLSRSLIWTMPISNHLHFQPAPVLPFETTSESIKTKTTKSKSIHSVWTRRTLDAQRGLRRARRDAPSTSSRGLALRGGLQPVELPAELSKNSLGWRVDEGLWGASGGVGVARGAGAGGGGSCGGAWWVHLCVSCQIEPFIYCCPGFPNPFRGFKSSISSSDLCKIITALSFTCLNPPYPSSQKVF